MWQLLCLSHFYLQLQIKPQQKMNFAQIVDWLSYIVVILICCFQDMKNYSRLLINQMEKWSKIFVPVFFLIFNILYWSLYAVQFLSERSQYQWVSQYWQCYICSGIVIKQNNFKGFLWKIYAQNRKNQILIPSWSHR